MRTLKPNRKLDVSLTSELSNKEEVRIYRLTVLEENQMKIMQKIDGIEEKLTKLDMKKEKTTLAFDNRLSHLEKRAQKMDATVLRFKFLIYAEAIALFGLVIKKFFGL